MLASRAAGAAMLCSLVACSDGSPQIYGPVHDGGDGGDGAAKADAALDAPAQETGTPDAGPDAPACASTIGLLGGNASVLFGAGGHALPGLTAQTLPGNLADCGADFACGVPAAIVPQGTGLLGVVITAAGALESTPYQSTWADPAAITGAVGAIDQPALAVVSGNAELVYQGADYKYYRAQYTQSWSPAAEPVGGGGSSQSFGARAPAAAAAGADLVTVQGGADGYLYTQDYSSSAWQPAAKNGSAAVQNTIPPAIVALTGGASELLAVYLRKNDYMIMSVDRKSGTWSSSPVQVNANAFTDDALALAPLPNGKALLVYRGSDKKPYFSVWDGQSWSVPAAALGSSNPSLVSAPSAARGVCGADAIVAWAETGGGVTVVPFTGSAFGAPQAVAGTSGAKFVAVGTLP